MSRPIETRLLVRVELGPPVQPKIDRLPSGRFVARDAEVLQAPLELSLGRSFRSETPPPTTLDELRKAGLL